MSHSKQINTAAASPVAPACQARESAAELIAALKAMGETPVPLSPADADLESHLADLVESIRSAAEWTRPTSAEGALLHLCLGYAAAYDIPVAANEAIQTNLERKLGRHMHAVKAYLIESAGALTEGFEEIFHYAMPPADDLAPKVTDAAAVKRPTHQLAI